MAHFALLDKNNIVQAVFYGRDEDNGKEAEISLRTGDTYKQTSYNTKGGKYYEWKGGSYGLAEDQSKAFRKNYAGIGYTYDAERDAFIAPQPFPSWQLDETSCTYTPPHEPRALTEEEFYASKRWRWDDEAYVADNTKGWVMQLWNEDNKKYEDITE